MTLENTIPFHIKTIVFDLGGVLFEEGKLIAVEKLYREKNYDKDIIFNILQSSKSLDLRAGLITDDEFWNWVQQQLPKGHNAHTIKEYWYDGYILDENTFNLVKNLHGKYKLIIFSGNIKSRVEYLEQKYHFKQYFDLEIYSYDYHLNKPQKEFVEVLINKSKIKPQEMIYIDDNEEAMKPAQELGINTVIYETGKIYELKDRLRTLGINF